ncbi:MAG: aminodeoxychorismate/anthranilate synthase component II [Actinomycetaceae bacterium]|nr:aminodeoxychorismate/anthranilate synthase component II [Actinomycetaceae bacterium]MDY5854305.1 aminodeoxychorismate/anthranilate synthase component II [Arcanobacterium sp.]
MILLIDNYDSFSYNLYQLIGVREPDIRVVRNDELSVEQVQQLHPDRIVISPGPGRPADAGICEELIGAVAKDKASQIPVLGVCLGHQAICEAFGANITYAKRVMHGKASIMELVPVGDDALSQVDAADSASLSAARQSVLHQSAPRQFASYPRHSQSFGSPLQRRSRLFAGMPERIQVARYHSLAADPATIPAVLRVTGVADDGDVMAIEHRELPIFGVQFHPESILTPEGMQILDNFLAL